MRRFLIAFCLILGAGLPVAAQDLVPDRRVIVTRDVDFYGSDLQPLFDTDLASCQSACLNDPACLAFTFNTRSNSCFPKSAITDRQPYTGAVSARVIAATPDTLARARDRAADLAFLQQKDLSEARAQAGAVALRHGGGAWDVPALLRAAEDARMSGDLAAATRWAGAATAQSDAAAHWLRYAELSLSRSEALTGPQRGDLATRALSASVNAYLRAGADQRVAVLLTLAQALEATSRGRDMIAALRQAESLDARADVTAALDDAIGKYGFRITAHDVSADRADARICAEFSDPLARAGVDYRPYVRLPDPRLAVEAEGSRLCISGVVHGERYAIIFRSGLPAANGERLVRDVPISAYVRDRAPSVAFPGRAYVLPRSPDAGLPIQTVNLDKVTLTLLRISDRNLVRAIQDSYFGRPLSAYALDHVAESLAETVWTGTGSVENLLNADMTTRLPIGDVVGALDPGIYALSAAVPGADRYDSPAATQWFILSDIGISTYWGSDGLTVAVRALGTAEAMAAVAVDLVSHSNRVLGQTVTDADGRAFFDSALLRGTAGARPALVTVTAGDDDMAFLSIDGPAFDLSDRGVSGRDAAGPVDAFLTTDRGAYRAGETIHATALVRDSGMRAIEGLPLTAILQRPDGVEHGRHVSDGGVAGGHVFGMPLAPSVPRGTWQLAIHADPDAPALAATTLLVEDFVPERIDVDLSLPEGPLDPVALPLLGIEARYLFDAPGADLPIEGSVALAPLRTLEAWPGYRFGRHDEAPDVTREALPPDLRTGLDGTTRLALPLRRPEDPGQPYELRATVRVSEGSGRPVERDIARPLVPLQPLIGIRPGFEGALGEGDVARFLVQGVGRDLAAAPMQVAWQVNRVSTRYQWYQQYGNWNWEPVTTRETVERGTADLGATPVGVEALVDWGRYEVIVERVGGSYTASSLSFDAGWFAPADAVQTPDMLELSLDRNAYRHGDTARLRIVPRAPGKAVISVLSDRVISMRTEVLSAGATVIELPVTDEWGTGVYVTAEAFRPMQTATDQGPGRALGLAHAAVAPGEKALDVRIDVPAEVAPRGPVTARIAVAGVAKGEAAHVTLAAVDQGILNLTGFESPDPAAHYFGQRRLGVDLRDLYGRLIDGQSGVMGRVRSGGDAVAQMQMQAPPPTEALVAFFEGPVPVGPDGVAEVRFDLPDFNGTARVMAVAWSPTAVGAAEAEVLVRDPVVISAAVPRFMAPGDESRLLLELVHASGPAGDMTLELHADGLVLPEAPPARIVLGVGERRALRVPVRAGAVGDHAIRIALTLPDGKRLTKALTLGVRANDPPVGVTRRFSLAPGKTFTLDAEVLGALRQDSASVLVSAGPLARLDVAGLITALDRYPYGCTEQVTSQTMPLLYLSAMAEPLGLGNVDRIATRIEQAVTRLLTRQAANGAFGLWSAGSGEFWLDAYVTDFLSRAKAQGIAVPDRAFQSALDNLANRVAYAPDFDRGGEDIAYALLVLAREGRATLGDLRYYADEKRDAFATPLAGAQLGAALASYGDQVRADLMFSTAADRIARAPETGRVWRADFGSPLRDAAGLLTLAVEARSDAVDRGALTARLVAPTAELSPQEQAWTLLAARALVDDPGASGLEVDGAPVTGGFLRRIAGPDLRPTTITNTADRPADITLTTLGVPAGPTEVSGYGYALSREYFTLQGAPAEAEVRTGDRLVTVLTVRPAEAARARLMIDDALPAGFEIDNPNLLRAGDVRGLDWLSPAETQHAEFRADRFLAAVDQTGSDPIQLAYIVRAVSPGRFHHPAALVEDMYRPEYRATTASGSLTVLP